MGWVIGLGSVAFGGISMAFMSQQRTIGVAERKHLYDTKQQI